MAVDAARVVQAWEYPALDDKNDWVPVTWMELDGSDEAVAVRGTLGEVLERLDAGRR